MMSSICEIANGFGGSMAMLTCGLKRKNKTKEEGNKTKQRDREKMKVRDGMERKGVGGKVP